MSDRCSFGVLIFPISVGLVMSYAYFSYTWAVVIPQFKTFANPEAAPDPGYVYSGSLATCIALFLVFNVLFWHCIASWLATIFTDPGSVPKDTPWIKGDFGIDEATEAKFNFLLEDKDKEPFSDAQVEFVRSLPVVERKRTNAKETYRFCKTCVHYKPDRTHHCRICQRCILRMDHHCPWVANCIGFNNHKPFMLFLFYAVLSAVWILGASFPRLMFVFRPVLNWGYWCSHDLLLILAYLFCLFIAIVLSIFLARNIQWVLAAMTTIERLEKYEDKNQRHRFDVTHKKFDKGEWGNWLHVFGPAWMWFWPIQPRNLKEGLYYTTTVNAPKEDTCCTAGNV